MLAIMRFGPVRVYNGEQAVSPRLARLPFDRARFHTEQFVHLFRARAPVTALPIQTEFSACDDKTTRIMKASGVFVTFIPRCSSHSHESDPLPKPTHRACLHGGLAGSRSRQCPDASQ